MFTKKISIFVLHSNTGMRYLFENQCIGLGIFIVIFVNDAGRF